MGRVGEGPCVATGPIPFLVISPGGTVGGKTWPMGMICSALCMMIALWCPQLSPFLSATILWCLFQGKIIEERVKWIPSASWGLVCFL